MFGSTREGCIPVIDLHPSHREDNGKCENSCLPEQSMNL